MYITIYGPLWSHAFLCLKTESGYMANTPDFFFTCCGALVSSPSRNDINHDKLLSPPGLPMFGPLEMNLMNSPLTFFFVLMVPRPVLKPPSEVLADACPERDREFTSRASLIFNTTTSWVLGKAKHTEDWPRRDSRDRPIFAAQNRIKGTQRNPRSI